LTFEAVYDVIRLNIILKSSEVIYLQTGYSTGHQ
jgi:hypothetical protein